MNHDLRRLISGIESRLTGSGGTLVFYGSSVHFGGLDKLLRITKDILRNGSTSLDSEGNPSCMPFAKEILPIASESELDEWIKDKMAHSLFCEALFHIVSAEESLKRHYDADALLRCPNSTEKLLCAAKCLDEQDLPTLVALDLRGRPPHISKKTGGKEESCFLTTSEDEEGTLSSPPLNKEDACSQATTEASLTLSSSCPGLTEMERSRFLRKKNWLHDEVHPNDFSSSSCLSSDPSHELRIKHKIPLPKELEKALQSQFETSSTHSESVLRMFCESENEGDLRGDGNHSSSTPLRYPVRGTEILRRRTGVHSSPLKTHRRAMSDTPVFRLSSDSTFHEEPMKDDSHEHNWSTVTPPTEGWSLPYPLGNESLYSFLSSGAFGRHQARLDKENAHLILAELIIQASTKKYGDPCMGENVLSPSSFRPPVREPCSQSPSVPQHSAESVALALLDQFDEGHEIQAVELNSIMGDPPRRTPEDDSRASFINSLKEGNNTHCHEEEPFSTDEVPTELRGTLDWAPPRPQLILRLHPHKNRSSLLEEQKYRCAGCGMKVEKRYSKTYRYCHYFGRLFCTGCHSNASHVIPAHVINKWDFKSYFVSDFASTILRSMYSDPLFNIQDLNHELLNKVSKLSKAIEVRSLSTKIYPFVTNCRLETQYMSEINNFPVIDPFVFSLKDLCRVKSKNYNSALLSLLENLMEHIMQCSLCKARGFLCEGCRSQDILFPFETDVHQCYRCYACYHVPCFTETCSKCLRIDLRKKSSRNNTRL